MRLSCRIKILAISFAVFAGACLYSFQHFSGAGGTKSQHQVLVVPIQSGISQESRSSRWPALRNWHLRSHPKCAFCGTSKDLEVHHKKPFHLFPELELEPSNLVTLCTHDHLAWGHLGNYSSYNPDIDQDIEWWRRKIANRPPPIKTPKK